MCHKVLFISLDEELYILFSNTCYADITIYGSEKYYLVDSGYANTDKFLVPFQGNRYHLSTFNNLRARRYNNFQDLYNHQHAQLRNCV